MFQVRSWPTVILHLDGDAFFAAVAQAVNPKLKGKPVVTGRERGIATAVSYEARKLGITRGMRTVDIKKNYPICIILGSDYELYGLFSQKMFAILKTFTPYVEEYSIDEGFADIKGLRKPLNLGYLEIGKSIQDKIEKSLGISVSVGISLTKSLAKLASSTRKPHGLTVVNGLGIENLLKNRPVEDIWGIGENTSAYLKKMGINTALQFASLSEEFILSHLTKPFYEIWRELKGIPVYELNFYGRTTYRSVTRSETFAPATNNADILFARLLAHVEAAFSEVRSLGYQVGKLLIYLKTQEFRYNSFELKINPKTAYPFAIHEEIKEAFKKIYQKPSLYRATGATVYDLAITDDEQKQLFADNKVSNDKIKKIYPLFEGKKVDFGTVLFDKERNHKEKPKLSLPIISI